MQTTRVGGAAAGEKKASFSLPGTSCANTSFLRLHPSFSLLLVLAVTVNRKISLCCRSFLPYGLSFPTLLASSPPDSSECFLFQELSPHVLLIQSYHVPSYSLVRV